MKRTRSRCEMQDDENKEVADEEAINMINQSCSVLKDTPPSIHDDKLVGLVDAGSSSSHGSPSKRPVDQLGLIISSHDQLLAKNELHQMYSDDVVQVESNQSDEDSTQCHPEMDGPTSPATKRRRIQDLLVRNIAVNLKQAVPLQLGLCPTATSSSTCQTSSSNPKEIRSEMLSDQTFEVSSTDDQISEPMDSSNLYFTSQPLQTTDSSPSPLIYACISSDQGHQFQSNQEIVSKAMMQKTFSASSDVASNSRSANGAVSWSMGEKSWSSSGKSTDPLNFSRRSLDFSKSPSSWSSAVSLREITSTSRFDVIAVPTDQKYSSISATESLPEDLSLKRHVLVDVRKSQPALNEPAGGLPSQHSPDVKCTSNIQTSPVIDLTEERPAGSSTGDKKLDLIRLQYQTSCEHFAKVCTLLKFLDDQKTKLEARRQSLQKTLIRLKLMYKISKLQNDSTTLGQVVLPQRTPAVHHDCDNHTISRRPNSAVVDSETADVPLPVDYSLVAQDDGLMAVPDDQLLNSRDFFKLIPAHEKSHSLQLTMEEQLQPTLAHVHKVDLSMYTYMYRPDDDDDDV